MNSSVFIWIQKVIRRNIHVYVLVRRFARHVCKYVPLEEGFDILKFVCEKNNSVAIDVGSNDGTSLAMIRRFQSQIQILCFDPILRPKGNVSGVSIFSFGLSDQEKEIKIFTPKVSRYFLWQYSSVSQTHIRENLKKDFKFFDGGLFLQENKTCLRALDNISTRPFFIKIDVEGHELEVLRGARKTLIENRPIILVEIQSLIQYNRIRDVLKEMDYYNLKWPQRSLKKDWSTGMNFESNQNNYVFLPNLPSPNWELKL